MNKLLPILLAVVLSGCTTLRTVSLPNGEIAQVVHADKRLIEDAYTYVSDVCLGKGYTIFDSETTYAFGLQSGYKIVFVCGKNQPIPKIYQDE